MRRSAAWSPAGVIAACAVAATLASQAPVRAAATWWYASSDHFEVYTTGNEKHAREAIADFERVHAFFAHLVDLPRGPAPRTRLIVFSTPKEFAPYKPTDAASAFYQSAPDGDFIVLQSLNADAMPVVVHEYAHLALRRTGIDYPAWLSEGFAEFYSTMTPDGSKMRLGLVPPRRMNTLQTAGRLIPLDRLIAIDDRSPEYTDQNLAPLFYAESWALTHMLLAHEQYRDHTAALLAAIAHGTPGADALPATYGKSLAAIGADLQNYLARYRYAYTLADSPAVPGDVHIASRPAGDAETEIALASLVGWQRGGQERSRADFAALEARVPDNRRLLEGRGLLEWFTQHHDIARPYLARAVALGSVDPAVLRAYASAISSTDPVQQEALLTRALVLTPDDIDLRIDLGRMLVEHRRAPEAVAVLMPVTRVTKERAFALFEVLTMAALTAGRIDDARAASARASGAARTAAEHQKAEALTHLSEAAQAERETTGRLTGVICGTGSPILEVTTDSGVLRLTIDSPRDIKTPSGETTSITLDCGVQSRAIHVGYLPVIDNARNTIGSIRMIEFLK